MSLVFDSAVVKNLVVDDRWEAIMFKAPHPLHRETAGWQPYAWREPIVGWATVECEDVFDDDGKDSAVRAEVACAVVADDTGALRPVPDYDSVLSGYFLYVARRGEPMDEEEIVRTIEGILAVADRDILAITESSRRVREQRGDLS